MGGKNKYDEIWASLSTCQAEVIQLREENKLLVSQVDKLRKEISKLEKEKAQLKESFFDICDDCIGESE